MERSIVCRLAASGLMLLGAGAALAGDLSGRWEGEVQIPDATMRIVVDLATGGNAGAPWVGSVVLPGRGVKGAPLAELVIGNDQLQARLDAAFIGPNVGPTRLEATLQPDGTLLGRFHQGGHAAPLVLRRSGAAQVDLGVPATAISPQLEGTWQGQYELGGYARDVTLTLSNRAGGVAGGELLIVGRRRSQLPIDRVVQGAQFVVLESAAAQIRIEGRWRDGEIDGQFQQGPFEAPLVLRRAAGKS